MATKREIPKGAHVPGLDPEPESTPTARPAPRAARRPAARPAARPVEPVEDAEVDAGPSEDADAAADPRAEPKKRKGRWGRRMLRVIYLSAALAAGYGIYSWVTAPSQKAGSGLEFTQEQRQELRASFLRQSAALLKSIRMVDSFKVVRDGSGLKASPDLLKLKNLAGEFGPTGLAIYDQLFSSISRFYKDVVVYDGRAVPALDVLDKMPNGLFSEIFKHEAGKDNKAVINFRGDVEKLHKAFRSFFEQLATQSKFEAVVRKPAHAVANSLMRDLKSPDANSICWTDTKRDAQKAGCTVIAPAGL